MKIAITGASGNIGSAVVHRLQPQHELVGIARRLPDPGPHPRMRWISIDLTRDDCRGSLEQAFRGADAVVHLAWGFQPSHDPGYLEELGVGGTHRVVEAAATEGVLHLVHMSSIGAYSPKVADEPVDETWPTGGVPGSPYSAHKAAAERILDVHEAGGAAPRVSRMRPGVVGQRAAGSSLLRYAVPGFVPAGAIRLLPVLPMDRSIAIPMVHADDVADAVERVLDRSAYGPFNLAAPPPIRHWHLAAALGARVVPVPGAVLRAAVAASWRVRIQQVDPGWVDLALNVPLLDCTKAHETLGWSPAADGDAVLRETLAGLADAAAGATPVLRPRTVLGRARGLVRRGPVSRRRTP